jgi:hypothetical protein
MKLILPLCVVLPRKTKADKKFYLNLNLYRNAHFHILNEAKRLYKEDVLVALNKAGYFSDGLKLKPPLRFTYTLFPPTAGRYDLGNTLPIVQKFTDDALIDFGLLVDDDVTVIGATDYRFGAIDRKNPRAELTIHELRTDDSQISLF